jgi:hypothetical protein
MSARGAIEASAALQLAPSVPGAGRWRARQQALSPLRSDGDVAHSRFEGTGPKPMLEASRPN